MQPVPQWPDAAQVFATVDGIYRRESRRVFATVIRLLGNFDIDEKALHDAFKSAVEQWPRIGIPNNPQAWLLSALQAVETATTVRLRNCQLSLTDGPFAETTEPLAGFYLIDAKDLNEVIHWASKIPPVRFGSVEVRPVWALEDSPTVPAPA